MELLNKLWKGLSSSKEETQSPTMSESIQCADITVILDRSASMVKVQQSVVDGFNEYVKSMRQSPGLNRWSMIQFDDPVSSVGGETFPQEIYSQCEEFELPYLSLAPSALQIQSMGDYRIKAFNFSGFIKGPESVASGDVLFTPRGGTALVDAMYETVEKTQARLSGRADVRPVIMVITDGEENSSCKHSSDELRALVSRTQAEGFEYIYLGANQDAFTEAKKYGVSSDLRAYAHTTGSVLDANNVSCTNNFTADSVGMTSAICSGMVGVMAVASGSVSSGSVSLGGGCNQRYK